jgi:hypothetical protein
MDIPKVSRKGVPMQDSACCDKNRTSVIFQVPDNLVFVGGIGKLALNDYARSHAFGLQN